MNKSTIRVATDVGGTFTDLVCFETDIDTGQHSVITAKSDTTPPNFEKGVLDVLEKGNVDPSEIDFLAHGTTVIINSPVNGSEDSHTSLKIDSSIFTATPKDSSETISSYQISGLSVGGLSLIHI